MSQLLRILLLVFSVLIVGEPAIAKDVTTPKTNNNDDAFTAIMSTKYDFQDSNISAGNKAPDGFFLTGKQPQSMSQMVQLRSGFKREHRNSRSGVKALTR